MYKAGDKAVCKYCGLVIEHDLLGDDVPWFAVVNEVQRWVCRPGGIHKRGSHQPAVDIDAAIAELLEIERALAC